MPLKRKQNHYNVKLLRGYGISISLKNSKIILKNGSHDITGESEKEEWFVNRMPYEKIVVSGKGYISTEAMSVLSENNRHVILVDTYGNPVTFLEPVRSSLTATQYRMGQYDTFRDKKKCDYLSTQIVKSKLDSQIRFLESTEKEELFNGISKLKQYRESLDHKNLKQIEAVSSRIYFREYSKLIDERFQFTKRNSIQIQKYNATDVINALLNYGYSVLAGEISKFVNGIGFDAYFGFYHHRHTSFQSLVYDIIEPFRWLVECAVWKMSDAKSKNRISKKQYAFTREGKVVLDSELIRRFLEVLERTFQKERKYDYKHGLKTKEGLKSVQEITIVKIMIQNFANYCIGKTYNLAI
ncbi:MAG: CRISPR-associated endonuclease Cas1 [Thaumarchaeota archaeon]|nr:CRISPR-associated endonuclease Cas1 [Nitrososphaerota archaeon]